MLVSVTEAYDTGRVVVAVEDCAVQLGVPVPQVQAVLAHLKDAELLEGFEGESGQWVVSRICPVTRQLLNLWPSPGLVLRRPGVDEMSDTLHVPGGSASGWPLPRR